MSALVAIARTLHLRKHMDEILPYTPDGESLASSGESWNDSIARSLDEQRARTRKFLSGYNERLADLESDLTSQIEQILQQLAQAKGERDDGALELAGQTEQLTRLRDMLGNREDEWRAEQTVSEQQQRDAVDQLRQNQEQLQQQQDAFEQESQTFEQARQSLQQQLQELQQREDDLLARQTGEVADLEEQRAKLREQFEGSQAAVEERNEQLDEQQRKMASQAE